jgi:DNA oxidative demethylase
MDDIVVNDVCNINVTKKADFLTEEEANDLFQFLETNVKYNSDKQSMVMIFGKKHKIPRKQVGYGKKGTSYNFSGTKVMSRSWASDIVGKRLKKVCNKVNKELKTEFNFVLVNRYKDGNDCIGYHSDDEKELVKETSIVGLSLGCVREIKFIPKKSFELDVQYENFHYPTGTYLEHGSLFSMNYPTNEYWKHGIPRDTYAYEPRISLTFRQLDM